MFKNYKNDFGLLLDEEKMIGKNINKSNKKANIKDGTFFLKYIQAYIVT